MRFVLQDSGLSDVETCEQPDLHLKLRDSCPSSQPSSPPRSHQAGARQTLAEWQTLVSLLERTADLERSTGEVGGWSNSSATSSLVSIRPESSSPQECVEA